MASSASSIESSAARVHKGVAPLRAGEGYSFLLRRLHSLSGVVPIGAFLIEHLISNSESANGVQAYNDQVKFLTSLPFVHVLEWVFIFLPLLYHALYGVYIWYRGESNVGEYPWTATGFTPRSAGRASSPSPTSCITSSTCASPACT